MKKVNCSNPAFYMLFVLMTLSTACKRSFVIEKPPVEAAANMGEPRLALAAGDPPQIKPLPVVWEEEWNSAPNTYIPGDHTQHMQGMAYSESDPDRIYMGQDVSNVWVSTNFGQNWSTLKNEGLGTNFVTSIEADPLNKNRLIASVNCRPYASINENYQGVYLSKNGGLTWELAAGRASVAAVRSSTRLIAYAPTTKNTSLGYATRWYAAFGEGDDAGADDGLLTSTNGGASWTEVVKLPQSIFGNDVRGIKVHKTNLNQVFLYGSAGLFKFLSATSASTINYTKISGTGNLPLGEIMGSLYQSNNGDTLIVAVVNQGIYKSANGGTSWSQLYAWTDINYCYVNENYPNKIFAVPRVGSQQIRISNTGGSAGSWFSPATADVSYREGYSGDWNKKLGGDFAYVLSDPRNPNKVFMHSKSKNYRSANGGQTWTWSDNGYNASSHSSLNADQMFDPNNSDRFCYFMVDKGPVFTTTRGRWFKNYVSVKPAGLNGQTCIGGALQPGTQVILATVGQNGTGQLIRSSDNGQSWGVVRSENKNRWVVNFSLQNTNVCYQWRERSDDGGDSWSALNNMPASSVICGVSRTNGNIIYAIKIEGTTTKIFRSSNRGDTWSSTPVIQAGWDLTVPGESTQFVFRVHPKNDSIVYTSSANGGITKWNLNNSTYTDLDIPTGAGSNYFHRFAIDPRYPNTMYVINQRANTGFKFFRSTQGGIGGSWENLSAYIPQGSVNGLAVSPVTGEVYISGENGSLVMLPPYATSNTAYSVVPYTMSHLTSPY